MRKGIGHTRSGGSIILQTGAKHENNSANTYTTCIFAAKLSAACFSFCIFINQVWQGACWFKNATLCNHFNRWFHSRELQKAVTCRLDNQLNQCSPNFLSVMRQFYNLILGKNCFPEQFRPNKMVSEIISLILYQLTGFRPSVKGNTQK